MKISNKPELIIVGSGKSILKYEFGEKINSFRRVARFNGYQLGENLYSKYVGTKTNFVFCNYSKKSTELISKQKKIFKNITYFLRAKNHTNTRKIVSTFRNKKIKFVYPISRYELYPDIKISLNTVPSLGLNAILYFLLEKKIPTLCIHGFDWVDNLDSIEDKHYYEDENINLLDNHDMKNEALLIYKLIEHKKIIELKNL